MSVRRALAFSVLERYLLIAIALASSMAIARLLSPAEIGLFSVSLALVGVAQVLRDFGVASYLIQAPELRSEHLRTAYGVLLLVGGTTFAALFLLAPWLAAFYDSPRMATVLRICALNFLALPFCTVSLAVLRREMRFRPLALVNVAAAAVGALASVGLALAGVGVESLAMGAVLVNLVTALGAWIARGRPRPLRPALSRWREVLGFGTQTSAAGVVTSISMDINDIAVGKILGFEPVALLSRAQGLMSMFHRDLMGAVRNVAFPAYAQAHREGRDLEPLYIASVANVTALAWPFYGFVSLFALEVLRLLYGPQWDAAAPLVPLFCAAGAIAAVASLIANLVVAMGRIGLVTAFELVMQPLRAATIVAAALWWGTATACAAALAMALATHVPVLYALKQRCVPNHWRALGSGLARSAGVAVATLAVPAAIAASMGFGRAAPGPGLGLLAAAVCAAVSWPIAVALLRHPMATEPAFVAIRDRVAAAWRCAP
jgi:O-antigen/teichoic acid export membrane protein